MMGDPLPCVRVNLLFTVEHNENHAEGVQRGHKGADQARHHQVDMTVGHRPRQDLILTEEACGNERQSGQRRAPHQEADVHQRNRFAQAAHLEDVLFVMAGENHRTRRQEQQRFKERVSHQMENRRVPCLHAQREEHVANLAHGRVGENAFDVGLHQRGEARQYQGDRPDDPDQMQHFRRHQEQTVGTGDQVDAGGDHGRGVDQRGNRRRTRHRIGKPRLQRQLGGFTDRAAEQHQRRPLQRGTAVSKVLRRQLNHFAEVEGTQFVVEDEQREGEEHVADASHHKRFHRCGAVLRIGVVETDQQVRTEAHAFPTEVHQQQVIGQYQNHHAGDKQVGIGEEAGISLFTAHVPGGEHVDQEADAGHHGEHGQRQAVQHQVEADVEIPYRHPGPQRHADRLFAVSEKVDADIGGDQRRQAYRAHANGGGKVFRPAPAGEGQQHKANQWQKNG